MKHVVGAARRLLKNSDAATAVEYALLAGLIAIGFVAGAGALGASLDTFLTNNSRCVSKPGAGNCSAPFGKGKGGGNGGSDAGGNGANNGNAGGSGKGSGKGSG